MPKQLKFFWLVMMVSVATLLYGDTQLIQAQDDAIEFPGEIMAINGNVIIVGGIAVDVSDAVLPLDDLTVGMTVQIIGTRQDQTITATIVVITDYGDVATPVTETTQEVTPEPVATATVEPTPEITPDDTDDDTVDGIPIIVIEGPVEAISVNFITIFDIDIEVDPTDPVLTQIRIGDTVRVEGESSFNNNTIVIIAVNITIVQTTIVVINNPSPGVVYIPSLPPSCKRNKSGKVSCKKQSRKSRKSS